MKDDGRDATEGGSVGGPQRHKRFRSDDVAVCESCERPDMTRSKTSIKRFLTIKVSVVVAESVAIVDVVDVDKSSSWVVLTKRVEKYIRTSDGHWRHSEVSSAAVHFVQPYHIHRDAVASRVLRLYSR